MNLNPDDWRDRYKDFLEINEIDGNPNDEHGLYEYTVSYTHLDVYKRQKST